MNKYEVRLLEQVKIFLDELDEKSRRKVIFNIWKSKEVNDPELFKKLTDEIWEFRTKYLTKQIRLLAFWDKTDKAEILVIATNGFIKKTKKTPKAEIKKAEQLRKDYFEQKKKGE
jgi:phage-related protein